MILSGLTAPNLPDGENYDSEHDIFIMMKDGQGLGVVQKDGSVKPFPYSFHVITGEPTGDSVNAKRLEDTKPKTVWQLPVSPSGKINLNELDSKDRQFWAGYDPAAEGSDKTAVGIYSRLPGGSIRLDGIIGDLGKLTDNSDDKPLPQFPEPSEWQEIPAPQPPGTAREFLARMFEPEPQNARLMFRPGDRVALKRPDLFGWIPVGAEGVIEHLEHPESIMASKGRHYSVRFELAPFNIPIDPAMLEVMKQYLKPGEPVPQCHENMTTNVGANDLELVLKGTNWGADYKQPYEVDALAETMANMTPADWHRELTAITSHLLSERQTKTDHMNRTRELIEKGELQLPNVSPVFEPPPFGFIDPARLNVPREVLDSTMERYRKQLHRDKLEPRPGHILPPPRTPGVPPDETES